VNERDLLREARESFAMDVGERVRHIVAAAEAEANAILHDAESDAQILRREAEAEALQYLDEAKRRADALVSDRFERLSDLSDAIVDRAETVVDRLDGADALRRQLDMLVEALGETAERIAREATGGPEYTAAPRVARPPERPAASEPTVSPDVVAEPPVAEEKSAAREAIERAERDLEERLARVTQSPPPEVPRKPEPQPEPVAEEPAPEAPARTEPAEPAAAESARPGPPPVPGTASEEAEQAAAGGSGKVDGARLVALQMAVGGSSRDEVDTELRRSFGLDDPSAILDDVFGERRRSLRRAG
jgi:hypothetical protein